MQDIGWLEVNIKLTCLLFLLTCLYSMLASKASWRCFKLIQLNQFLVYESLYLMLSSKVMYCTHDL